MKKPRKRLFQFQKVRLKVKVTNIGPEDFLEFQFQKVRLKDHVEGDIALVDLYFNSKRFD